MNLENIREISFDYFDENEYIYNFEMLENRTSKVNDQEYKFYLICKNTNVSANGEIFLNLKVEENKLVFRTDYFANSFDYIELKKDENKSTISTEVFTVNFDKDIFELKISF